MNKKFTPLLLAAIALGMSAKAANLHFLDLVETTTGFDRYEYRYTDFNKVSQILHIDYDYIQVSSFRTFTYDDKHQLIKENISQDYFEEEELDKYIPVIQIDYEWNGLGQMIRRTSWNVPAEDVLGEMEQMAIMEFEYDMQGRLSKVTYKQPNGIATQHDDYTYDDATNRLIERQVWITLYGSNYLGNTIRYTYNEAGDIANLTGYDSDPTTGALRPNSITDFVYNSEGDLEEIQEWSSSRTMMISKKAFKYLKDFSIEDTVYPNNFEDAFWSPDLNHYELTKHPIQAREEYALNESLNILELNDTYEFSYTEERKPDITGLGGVEMIASPTQSVAFKSLRNGLLQLDGISNFDTVSIYDMEGRFIMNKMYGSGLNVEGLAPGSYCAVATGGVVKFVK